MSVVERVKQLVKDPLDTETVNGQQTLANDLVSQFVGGEIDLETLRTGLSQIQQTEGGIILSHPGPVYGFLRRLGFPIETAEKIADEERKHYWMAKQAGLNPKFIFELSTDGSEASEGILFHAFLSYEIPDGDPETIREAILRISLAPDEPSPDDLAKIPPHLRN